VWPRDIRLRLGGKQCSYRTVFASRVSKFAVDDVFRLAWLQIREELCDASLAEHADIGC
jgi:hypothetical protein